MGFPMRAIALLLILFLSACSFHAQPEIPGTAWSGMVFGVTDGDTLTIMDPERGRVTVRLYGIDTPEVWQPGFGPSSGMLYAMSIRQDVKGITVDVDRYGRDVALVRVKGADLSEALVRAGQAWVYPRYCRLPFCAEWEELQEQAQDRRLGLWGDVNPIPPWEWRRGKR